MKWYDNNRRRYAEGQWREKSSIQMFAKAVECHLVRTYSILGLESHPTGDSLNMLHIDTSIRKHLCRPRYKRTLDLIVRTDLTAWPCGIMIEERHVVPQYIHPW